MARYSKNRRGRKCNGAKPPATGDVFSEPEATPPPSSAQDAPSEETDATSSTTVLRSPVQIPQDAVEVHWIPASVGSVIHIPGGRGARVIQFHDSEGRIVEVPFCHDDHLIGDTDSTQVSSWQSHSQLYGWKENLGLFRWRWRKRRYLSEISLFIVETMVFVTRYQMTWTQCICLHSDQPEVENLTQVPTGEDEPLVLTSVIDAEGNEETVRARYDSADVAGLLKMEHPIVQQQQQQEPYQLPQPLQSATSSATSDVTEDPPSYVTLEVVPSSDTYGLDEVGKKWLMRNYTHLTTQLQLTQA